MRNHLHKTIWLAAIIALIVVLVAVSRSRKVTVTNQDYTWELELSVLANSKWNDKSKPPDLTFVQAYQKAQQYVDDLNDNGMIAGRDWEVINLELLWLDGVGPNCWAYLATLEGVGPGLGIVDVQQLTLMLPLNGEVVCDPNQLKQINSWLKPASPRARSNRTNSNTTLDIPNDFP